MTQNATAEMTKSLHFLITNNISVSFLSATREAFKLGELQRDVIIAQLTNIDSSLSDVHDKLNVRT